MGLLKYTLTGICGGVNNIDIFSSGLYCREHDEDPAGAAVKVWKALWRTVLIHVIAWSASDRADIGEPRRKARREVRRNLHAYSDEGIGHILAAALAWKANPTEAKAAHVAAVYGAVAACRPEGFIHAYRVLIDRSAPGIKDRKWLDDWAAAILSGVIADPESADIVEGIRNMDSPGASALLALCHVIDAVLTNFAGDQGSRYFAAFLVFSGSPRTLRLANTDLQRLILRSPRDAGRIATVIVERRTDDVEVIRAALGSSAALQSGAL